MHTAEGGGFVGRHVAGDIALEIEIGGLLGLPREDKFAVLHPDVLAAVVVDPFALELGPVCALVAVAGDKARDALAVLLNLAEAVLRARPEVACAEWAERQRSGWR